MRKNLLFVLIVFVLGFTSAASANDSLYKLGAGDVIRITVYGEPDLDVEQKIDNRESVDYPYLGEVSLKNKTLIDVKQEIYDGLKGDYIVNPEVNVAIVRYRNIYVNGLVNRPGAYEYEPGLTVQKALSLAGGVMSKYRRSAKAYHTDASESAKYANLSADELADAFEKNTETEAESYQTIQPGDTIYVVASFW